MNLFGFNISISHSQRSHAATLQRSLSPDSWLRGEDLDNKSAVLSNAYQQVVWVYRAINILAEAVANIPFLFSTCDRGRESLISARVTYTGGFVLPGDTPAPGQTPLPPDLEQAAIEQVAYWFRNRAGLMTRLTRFSLRWICFWRFAPS
jgi:hypothetical protein